MERTIVYQVTSEDLKIFLIEEMAKKDLNASLDELLKKHKDTFVGVSEAATILKVHPMTVRNYIKDGLIEPEVRTVEKGNYKFRLSYLLTLDYSQLKQQLKTKKCI
jgi:AmiR/NasT family two-component response regulator